ncbi:hypothetical protein [Tatumella morbirosei]|nr:hypothetical protein [Tatumella morbirosei]
MRDSLPMVYDHFGKPMQNSTYRYEGDAGAGIHVRQSVISK